MNQDRIEISAVLALRVDAAGRVGRLAVYGLSYRDDQRVKVEACVADVGPNDPFPDQGAAAIARMVDPERDSLRVGEEVFPKVKFKPDEQGRRAYAWVAEIDLLLSPALPPVMIGSQAVPLAVRAFYFYKSDVRVLQKVVELAPVPEFHTGVLLVHGIGVQRRAETLSEWSAPLLRWINAWLDGGADDIARNLQKEPVEGWRDSLVAYDEKSLTDPTSDHIDRNRYARALANKVVAERSRRAKHPEDCVMRDKPLFDKSPPNAAELAERDKVISKIGKLDASAVGGSAEFREAYLLDVGSHASDPSSVEMHVEAMAADGYILRSRWMLAESHWAQSFWAPSFFRFARWCLLIAPIVLVHYNALARVRYKLLRRIFTTIGLSVGVTLAQLAFIALMVLWLVPWKRLRSYVLHVQMALSGVVGDSYILLEDPVQRRAIIDRVQRDLNWLVHRCRNVVVVAHSQGAAVAEMVLSGQEEEGPGKIHSFITLGAGIQTLNAIRKYARNREVNIGGWLTICSTLLLGGAAVVALAWQWQAGAGLAILALAGQAYGAYRGAKAHGGLPGRLPRAASSRPWFDFFATKDPVPYGPAIAARHFGGSYRKKEVRNRDSYLSDHVLYWQNAEQVVGRLVTLIGEAACFKPLIKLLPDDETTFTKLEHARLSRLSFLRAARLVMLLATAMLLYATWDAWFAIGFWAAVWVQAKLSFAMAAVRAPALAVWLQALVVFVPFVVHKSLVNAIFDSWTTAEVERLLRRSAGRPATHWAAMFTAVLVIVVAGTIEYIWPVSWPVFAAATAAAAIVFGWIARSVHVKRTDAPHAVAGLVGAKRPA